MHTIRIADAHSRYYLILLYDFFFLPFIPICAPMAFYFFIYAGLNSKARELHVLIAVNSMCDVKKKQLLELITYLIKARFILSPTFLDSYWPLVRIPCLISRLPSNQLELVKN